MGMKRDYSSTQNLGVKLTSTLPMCELIANHTFGGTGHALPFDPRQQLVSLYEAWSKPEKARE
jgi:hypothetical protein